MARITRSIAFKKIANKNFPDQKINVFDVQISSTTKNLSLSQQKGDMIIKRNRLVR